MTNNELPKVLEFAKELAKQAGRIILDIYQKDFSVDYKDDSSPVTEADKKPTITL